MEFLVVISGHNGLLTVKSNDVLTPFAAASVALRVAGTECDTGYIAVQDVFDSVEQFEFVRVGDMLAIV